MSTRATIQAALLLSLLAPAALSAQSTSTSRGYQSNYTTRSTLLLFANGGGNSSLANLNDAGTASLGTSWTAGGGLGVQLNRYTAVRGTFERKNLCISRWLGQRKDVSARPRMYFPM